jgi:predicted ATPase/DNA-binding SARP family transcriptional activator
MFSPAVFTDSHLTISVLGPLQFRLGLKQITRFEFERVRALLVYLAVEAVPHERAWLAYLFWPEAPLKTGLQNLRQTLAALRRALQDKEQKRPFLLATSTTIGVNPDRDYALDFERFTNLLKEASCHKHRRLGACSSCIHKLEEAVGLYRGDFAGGLSVDSEPFEEWLRQKQEQTHLETIRTLGHLTDYYLRHNQLTQAIQAARRQLVIDPLCDMGHHQLILAMAADGQRHVALKQWEQYKTLLESELMLPLPEKTAALYGRLVRESWKETTICPLPRHNLPRPLTPFVGYEQELAMIRAQLARDDNRLLTLTGIVGSGKSRMALAAAWAELPNFADGVYYLDLESVAANELLPAVARTMLPTVAVDQPLGTELTAWLRDKEALLVLDHFDHLVASDAVLLPQLLREAPQLQILATSREWLKVRGETCLEISGLAYPANIHDRNFDEYEAVRFFRQRMGLSEPGLAQGIAADREAILHICRHTGGNPRALELYAQVVALCPLNEVIEEVDQLSPWGELLSKAWPQRQRSLKAMFRTSWRMLSREERRTLIVLAVFEGSFTLVTAQRVSQARLAGLLSLQAKSWLQSAGSMPEIRSPAYEQPSNSSSLARYRLPILFRHYLLQTIGRNPSLLHRLQRQHALFFMNFLRQNLEQAPGERCPTALLKAIQGERSNIEQALAWARATQSHLVTAQLEQDLTLFHLCESRYQVAEWPAPELANRDGFSQAIWV